MGSGHTPLAGRGTAAGPLTEKQTGALASGPAITMIQGVRGGIIGSRLYKVYVYQDGRCPTCTCGRPG